LLAQGRLGQCEQLDRTGVAGGLREGLEKRGDGTPVGALFAAFNILNGKVIGTARIVTGTREFARFLDHLEWQLPLKGGGLI
jgi:hypothetical protein